MASPSADRRTVVRRWVAGLVVVIGTMMTGGTPASAHAVVDEIVPADGSVMAAAPTEVVVRFSEDVLEDYTEVEIVSSGGAVVEGSAVRLDPADASILHVTLPDLEPVVYEVAITTRDRADLHEVTARTSFGIGTAAPAPSPPARTPALGTEAWARWVFAAGLAVLCGVVVVRARWPETPIARPAAVRHLAIGGIGLVLLGRLGVIVARGADLGVGWSDAWTTTLGTGDVRRLPFVVLAAACVLPVARRQVPIWLDVPWRDGSQIAVREVVAGAGVLWLALLASWGDHAALTGSVEPAIAIAKTLHLLGIGTWIGVLVVAGLANRRSGLVRVAWSSVSSIAVVGAVTAVASGLVLTGRLVVSLTALLSTAYGTMLVAKVVLVAVAAWLGWRSRRRSHAVGPRVTEALVLGVVVAAGATMATAGPAIERSFVSTDAEVAPTESSVIADDLLVQVQAIPGRPGPNTVQVRLHDRRRPAPAPFESVVVTGPDGVAVTAPIVEGVAFVDGIELPTGQTPVDVVVRRTDWAPVAAVGVVVTETPEYRAPVRISSRPIGPTLRTVGWVVLAAASAVWIAALRRRRRQLLAGGEREEASWDDIVTR